MRCPNCGAEGQGNFCEYCGAQLPRIAPESVNNTNVQDHSTKKVVNNYYIKSDGTRRSDPDDYNYGQPGPNDWQGSSYNSYEAPRVSSKDWLVTLLLCIFLGELGVHHFYAGRIGKGILYLLTLGLLGIGWIIDIIFIVTGNYRDRYGLLIVRDAGANRYSAGATQGRSVNWEDSPYSSAQTPRRGRKRLYFILMIIFIVFGGMGLIGGSGISFFVILAVVFGVLYAKTPGDEE